MLRLTRPLSTTRKTMTMTPMKTFWTAQVHVIGELLAVRRATSISGTATTNGAAQSFSTTSRSFGRNTMSQRIPQASIMGNTLRARLTTGNGRKPWTRYGDTSAPATTTRMLIQNRGFHASRRADLPAPAVIFAAGALLKVRPSTLNPANIIADFSLSPLHFIRSLAEHRRLGNILRPLPHPLHPHPRLPHGLPQNLCKRRQIRQIPRSSGYLAGCEKVLSYLLRGGGLQEAREDGNVAYGGEVGFCEEGVVEEYSDLLSDKRQGPERGGQYRLQGHRQCLASTNGTRATTRVGDPFSRKQARHVDDPLFLPQ